MKVFLSWSGPRSRYIAESLRGWLPRVIQSVRPWMSDEDISAGSRWLNEVSSELSQAKLGIICVTAENQSNPWLLFEAGALSKTLDQTHVCPFLFDLSPGQLSGPLSQFQATEADRDGTYRIVATLNRSLGPNQLPQNDLDEIFEVWWPRLSDRLSAVPAAEAQHTPKRTVDELLEEVVANTREQIRRENLRLEHMQEKDAKMDEMLATFQHMTRVATQMQTLPSALESLVAQAPHPTREDLAGLFRAMPTPDPATLQNLVASMKDMSDRERAFTRGLLDGSQADDSPNNRSA